MGRHKDSEQPNVFVDITEFEVRELEKERTKNKRDNKKKDKEKYKRKHRFDDDEY